jgi:hypothetical protein
MHPTHCGCSAPVETHAPIAVTINPEARVNVARTPAPIGRLTPAVWHRIDVTLVNEGFVTGPLTIETESIPGVHLDLPVHELTGEHRQEFAFRVLFEQPTVADVPLTFRALAALGGLATHSTIHLFLRADENLVRALSD